MTQYLGGFLGPESTERLARPKDHRPAAHGNFFVRAGVEQQAFDSDPLTVIVSGYAVPRQDQRARQGTALAQYVSEYYEQHAELPIAELEGSYTLALIDRRARRILLYRNLVGNAFIYYAPTADGFLFGNNLAALADSLERPRPNEAALPAFFFFRYVPGRDTLFAGVSRLMPGELVTWQLNGVFRSQREVLPEPGTTARHPDLVEQLNQVVGQAVRDCAAAYPAAANLLSGGVDSSHIQCMWGLNAAGGDRPPRSFSLFLDHPQTQADTEYARSASALLGTKHQFVSADRPYGEQLIASIAATGEAPHHVQSVYYPTLARAMVTEGAPVGLCGQGADALFGLGWVTLIRRALSVRRWLPFKLLRSWALQMAGPLATPFRRQFFMLANDLNDPVSPNHPLNRVAAYGSWSDVAGCFGAEEASHALAQRRAMLSQYAATSGGLLAQIHGCDFLSDSIDTAALWAGLFSSAGGSLLCPYLDSRVVRFAVGLSPEVRFAGREPKALLKDALARLAPRQLAYRSKLAFGQPVFEWLGHDGQLRSLVEDIAHYDFVHPAVRAASLAQPNWFLYSLLCYDIWHKLFIDRSLPRPTAGSSTESASSLQLSTR